MQEIALGNLGMSDCDFWDATPRSLFNRVRGYQRVAQERERTMWERERFFTVAMMNVHLGRKHAIRKVQDLVRFPWEMPKRKKPAMKITDAEYIRKGEKADAYFKALWEKQQREKIEHGQNS